jgi:cystathionine gamma-synthase
VVIGCFDAPHAEVARVYWQHTGEGVSSRQAEACLNGVTSPMAAEAKQTLRRRIAGLANARQENVLLFGTGMAAIYTIYRALRRVYPDRRAAQFGFPYVDTLKVLEKFGPGAAFFPQGTDADLDILSATVNTEPLSGIFTEVPSNPLLTTPKLMRLAALCRFQNIPLIVDDTIATWVNTDVLHLADITCASLTKAFSGVGDVAGGVAILNPNSIRYQPLFDAIRDEYDDTLSGADALVLEANSRDYYERIHRMNATAIRLTEHLHDHPKVRRVYYPSMVTRDAFDAVRRFEGGYGPLISIDLHDAANAAPKFYDALRCCKGPNLGTNFTLVCPYTILAHYGELDWAESCGVSRYLMRISVGLEPAEELIARFDEALG